MDETHERFQELFGELRSLLAHPAPNDAWGSLVFEHVRDAHALDERRFRDVLEPYVRGRLRHLDQALTTLGSLEDLEDAARIAPWATFDVDLHRKPDYQGRRGAERLARCAAMSRVRALRASHVSMGARGVVLFLDSPNMGAIESLDLSNNDLRTEGFTALASSSTFPSLRRLKAWSNRLEPAAIEALTRSDALPELRELDVSLNPLGPSAPTSLERAGSLTKLTSLGLGGTSQTTESFEALVRSDLFPGLERLSASSNQIGDASFDAVPRAGSALEHLDLAANRISAHTLEALARPGAHPNLRELNVQHCQVQDREALARFASSELAARLTHLYIDAGSMGDVGVEVLLAPGRLGNLEVLTLGRSNLSHVAAETLGQSPCLRGLKTLSVWGNELGDEGFVRLLSEHLEGLEELIVYNAKVTAKGIRRLVESSRLPNLRRLHVVLGKELPDAMRARLEARGVEVL